MKIKEINVHIFKIKTVLATRLFHGFSSGGITSVAPVLLAETSTPEQRSQSVTMALLVNYSNL